MAHISLAVGEDVALARPAALGGGDQAQRGVTHVHQAQTAVDDEGKAPAQVEADRPGGAAPAIAGPDDVAGVDDDDVAPGPRGLERITLSFDLACGVGHRIGAGGGHVAFVDRVGGARARAERRDTGDVHEASGRIDQFQQPARALGVGRHQALAIAALVRDQTGHVIDELTAVGGLAQTLGVIHRDPRRLGSERRQSAECLLVATQRPHLLALPAQDPHQLRAEKAGRAGDADHVAGRRSLSSAASSQAIATGARISETISFETHQVQ